MVAQIGQFLASIWQLFTSIDVPGLGISFATLYLGVFAISVSIKVLMPILGIGGNVERGPVRLGRSVRARRDRTRRADALSRQSENTRYIVVRK